MKKLTYIVIQTGKRTWQVAAFDRLDSIDSPIFSLLSAKFKNIDLAQADREERQQNYNDCGLKVCHELAYSPEASNCTKPVKRA
jgi:hypothetical protein